MPSSCPLTVTSWMIHLGWFASLAATTTTAGVIAVNQTNTTTASSSANLFRFTIPTQSSPLQQNLTSLDNVSKLVEGSFQLVNFTTLTLEPETIAVLSCDNSSTYENTDSVFQTIIGLNPQAVVLYTLTADYCNLTNNDTNGSPIFSTTDAKASQELYGLVSPGNRVGPVCIARVSDSSSQDSSSAMNNTNSSQFQGPPTTTAVAMIILYSITGIITILFLAIIITGVVRAHRHPERYGLRVGLGRPRQSRARGLARAMLDSLPIVKFGERDGEEPASDLSKAGDIEMINQSRQEPVREVTAHGDETAKGVTVAESETPPALTSTDEISAPVSSDNDAALSGIAAAAAAARTNEDNTQGCSICTEDFERGQDQRVLPCDHRFHPACVDPWLLNVSGTCPLCRIDLNPQRTRSMDGDELYEDDGDHATAPHAPPLAEIDGDGSINHHRLSSARDIVAGIMGLRSSQPMSNQEREMILSQLRRQRQARTDRSVEEARDGEEEGRLRARLRSVFHVRTRRTEPNNANTQEATTTVANSNVEGSERNEHTSGL